MQGANWPEGCWPREAATTATNLTDQLRRAQEAAQDVRGR